MSKAMTFLLYICLLFLAGCSSDPAVRVEQPNVVLISIDTLRADHLGCYGYTRNTSPFIDSFSREALLYEKCYAPAPSTLPSHASMFTSLLPFQHGAYFTRKQPLAAENVTLAEILKTSGYKTVSFNDGGQVAADFGMDQGFDIYDSEHPGLESEDLTFDRIVGKSVKWLEENSDKKFFMFLHTYETHHPYNPDPEVLREFESSYQGQLPRDISVETVNRINLGRIPARVQGPKIELSEEDRKHIVNAYDTEIKTMDAAFGRLIEYLKRKGLYENTIIIFTSDHGEEFGEHGVWATHSYSLYNELLHVPLIIKNSGPVPASGRISHLAGLVDIVPTLLSTLNITPLPRFAGLNLNLAASANLNRRIPLIAERDSRLDMQLPLNWTIQDSHWKLYRGKLYDLVKDPGELTDLSQKFLKIKRNFESRFLQVFKKSFRVNPDSAGKLKPELQKKLKSLGYL